MLADPQEYIKLVNDLKEDEDPEVASEMKKGVSVFYGVDRDIFKDGMVAMTSKAIAANATGDSLWAQKQKESDEEAAGKKAAAKAALIASGVVTFGTLVAYSAFTAYISSNFTFSGTRISFGEAFFGETFIGESGYYTDTYRMFGQG